MRAPSTEYPRKIRSHQQRRWKRQGLSRKLSSSWSSPSLTAGLSILLVVVATVVQATQGEKYDFPVTRGSGFGTEARSSSHGSSIVNVLRRREALEEDNADDTPAPTTAAPGENSTTPSPSTAAPDGGNTTAAPDGGNTTAAPTVAPTPNGGGGNSTAAPTTGNSTAAPTPTPTTGNSTAAPTPTPGNSTAAPTAAPGNSTSAPTAAPTPGNSTAAPTPGNSTAAPTPGNSTAAPTQGNSTAAPTPGNSTAPPTPAPSTVSPGNATTPAPTTVSPTTVAPTTTAPATAAPTSAPTTVPPAPAKRNRIKGFFVFVGKVIAWLIIIMLSVIAFGAIMSNRYRIYFFFRGVWYTILGMECTNYILRKLRIIPEGASAAPPVDANLNTIIFDSEMSEGLLMRESD